MIAGVSQRRRDLKFIFCCLGDLLQGSDECRVAVCSLHGLKWAANRDLRWTKTAARNRNHGRSSFGKRNGFRLHLNKYREGFSQRGRGRSFHALYTGFPGPLQVLTN